MLFAPILPVTDEKGIYVPLVGEVAPPVARARLRATLRDVVSVVPPPSNQGSQVSTINE